MNDSEKLVKFLKKFLQNDKFEIDSFVYEFVYIGVSKDYEGAFDFHVNVILPDPNQSYIVNVFDENIRKLIIESFNFLGRAFSYSIEISVDGQELTENTYARIRNEQLIEIINSINKNFAKVGLTMDYGDGEQKLTMDCNFRWDGKMPYELRSENLYFNTKLSLSNFKLDGEIVVPNPNKLNKVAGTLFFLLADRDWFSPRIEDIIYDVIGPETKIHSVDEIYAVFVFQIKNLNGVKVKQDEKFWKLQPDDFIST